MCQPIREFLFYMNYKRIHDEIIARAKSEQRKKTKDGIYYEQHHIIPRCMGGDNSKENLVLLTAREHFLVHWLLAEIYNSYSLWFAFHKMCYPTCKNKNNRYIPSSRIYKLLKDKVSAYGKRKRTEDELNLLRNNFKGRKHTEESKLKIKNSCKNYWNLDKREEQSKRSKKMWNLGITNVTSKGMKHSEETKLKLSIANIGKVMSEDSKLKMSKAKKGIAPKQAIKISSEKRKIKIKCFLLNGELYNIYNSIREAAIGLNLYESSISRVLSGVYNKLGNYKFEKYNV